MKAKREPINITKTMRLQVWDEWQDELRTNGNYKITKRMRALAKKHNVAYSTLWRWTHMPREQLGQLHDNSNVPNKKQPRFQKIASIKKEVVADALDRVKVAVPRNVEHSEKLFMQSCTNVLSVDDALCVMLEYQRLR